MRALGRSGFRAVRQVGSHVTLWSQDGRRKVVVPMHASLAREPSTASSGTLASTSRRFGRISDRSSRRGATIQRAWRRALAQRTHSTPAEKPKIAALGARTTTANPIAIPSPIPAAKPAAAPLDF
ncbi:MAG: type II toxin-antitoxin system HicA family toxin [Halobacteriales archaeon]|nr:type II toxin-antitoxin system HicA family toxin [Halobacteriales archaeon]